jgi:hypothetical protein
MTAEEFVEQYKGQCIKIAAHANDIWVGEIGVVKRAVVGAVIVEMNDGFERGFLLRELEPIGKPDNEPLPLPG